MPKFLVKIAWWIVHRNAKKLAPILKTEADKKVMVQVISKSAENAFIILIEKLSNGADMACKENAGAFKEYIKRNTSESKIAILASILSEIDKFLNTTSNE